MGPLDEDDDITQPAMETAPPPSWYTPRRLLALLCVINLLVYIDRGVVSSTGVKGEPAEGGAPGRGIRGEFGLSNAEDGLVFSIFMVGMLAGSPVFAQLVKTGDPLRLVAVGLTAWVAAATSCSLSWSYGQLLASRAFVGLGEASFVCLAAPFIDDAAPPAYKTRWFAYFYMGIPVGVALGIVLGTLGSEYGWRTPFAFEAVAMAPFAIFCWVAPSITLQGCKGSATSASSAAAPAGLRDKVELLLRGMWRDVLVLARTPVYVVLGVGYILYNATLGVYQYYGPEAGLELFGLKSSDTLFGAVTVVTGIGGTVAGGVLLDRMGSSMENAFTLAGRAVFLGFVLLMAGCLLRVGVGAFFVFLAAGEFCVFLAQAPLNGITVWCVPDRTRPFAMSLIVILIHMLGDVPAPPLIGLLKDALDAADGCGTPRECGVNWRYALSVATALLFFSAAVLYWGATLAPTAYDNRREGSKRLRSASQGGEEPDDMYEPLVPQSGADADVA